MAKASRLWSPRSPGRVLSPVEGAVFVTDIERTCAVFGRDPKSLESICRIFAIAEIGNKPLVETVVFVVHDNRTPLSNEILSTLTRIGSGAGAGIGAVHWEQNLRCNQT